MNASLFDDYNNSLSDDYYKCLCGYKYLEYMISNDG